MSWGLDIRLKDLLMLPAEVDGGLEPQVLPPTRQAIRAAVAARIADYTPEWTNRRTDDAGMALVMAYGTVAESIDVRLNRVPTRLALEHLDLAGVRALQARPAQAILAIEVAPRATAPLVLAAGSPFLVPGGATPVVVETSQTCHAMPGTLASVAVLADGWVLADDPAELAGLAPFGPRPQIPAELWLGIESTVAPGALLSVAVELVSPPQRATSSAVATAPPAAAPTLRWEAMASAGATELPVERDDSAGLSQSGVLVLRSDTASPWLPGTLPGRPDDAPLYWLRARLITNDFPDDRRLARMTLNGVTAVAARSIRGEVCEPLDRSETGRTRYRLSQIPVVPGSVLIDVTDATSDPFGTQDADDLTSVWEEVDDLGGALPDDRVFLLDAGSGIATFGDGVHGRAVPQGYRNVVARVYMAGGGSAGLPAPGDTINAQQSIPNLVGATVLTITSGADAETSGELVLRGPSQIRSRGRAVAPSDYATLALSAEGVDVARAHCLPGTDPRTPGAPVPGVVGVIVVPQATVAGGRPVPSPDALRAVADHLAREVGVVGAEVVAAEPRYREIAAEVVLVARAGSDLAAAGSAARDAIDRWLDPLQGWDGTGWPFGAPVRWDVLTRLLLAEQPDTLTAVARLALRIDGRRLPACVDAALEPGELTWPGSHVIDVIAEERSS
jgi:predicted phage baseplate assembly protein